MNPILPASLFALAAPCLVAAQALLVSSRFTHQVLEFGADGRFVGVFAEGGGLRNPVGLSFGPDGALYVGSGLTDQVLRYDGVSGAFLGVAVAAGGPLRAPRNLVCGPDGLMYVCSGGTNQVLRFDPRSSAPPVVFAQATQLMGPTSLTFLADGDLYVGSVLGNVVARFDRAGVARGVLAGAHLNGPHDIAMGPEGLLYISNAFGAERVVLFTPAGAFVDVFVADPALVNPLGLTFTGAGDLLIANQGGDEVRRYDGLTGQFRDALVAAGSGGLDGPLFAIHRWLPGRFTMGVPNPPGTGPAIHFPVSGGRAGSLVLLVCGTQPGPLPLPWPGQTLGISDPLLLALGLADEGGHAVWRFPVPAAVAGAVVRLQAVDLGALSASGLAEHRF